MIDVQMPQMGESIVEGTLTKWLKKPGDRVERDEPIFEISTDKVDTEIPSPAAGTLAEIVVQEGTTVGINTIVARIEDGASPAAAPAPAVAAAAPAPVPVAAEALPPEQPRGRGRRRKRRTALPAGAQDGARAQYRPGEDKRHRRRRTHHQAGP